jgi:hypothetical protein
LDQVYLIQEFMLEAEEVELIVELVELEERVEVVMQEDQLHQQQYKQVQLTLEGVEVELWVVMAEPAVRES